MLSDMNYLQSVGAVLMAIQVSKQRQKKRSLGWRWEAHARLFRKKWMKEAGKS
jgi:hypothetical protein